MVSVYKIEQLDSAIGIVYNKAVESLNYGKPVELSCDRIKKQRSSQQNRFIHALFKHIVEEYERTGWCFGDIAQKLGFVNEEIVKQYCKFRFDVKSTSGMNTKDCMDFTNKIQKECIEESKGEYERIDPPEDLLPYTRELTMGGLKGHIPFFSHIQATRLNQRS